MKLIPKDEREDFDRILIARGYRPDDFDATAEDDPLPVYGTIITYAIKGEVTVRRKSTNQVRQYRGTPWSPWLREGFQHDLEAGFFSTP